MVNSVAVFDSSNAFVAAYTTIQEAVDASSAGYSIHISAGTYNESVTIDVAISIFGAGVGQTIVTPPSGSGFVIGSDLGTNATLSIDGVEFLDSPDNSGVQFTNNAILGTLQITNCEFENNFRNGVAIGGNNAAVDLDNVIITDTDFFNNGGNPNLQTSSGDGDIIFFQYHGDATITDVNLVGAVVGAGPAENGIQFRGDFGAMGNVTLTNVNISGVYEKTPLAVFNYDDVDGLSGSNNVITADSTSFSNAVNFDSVDGDIDFASLGIDATGAPDIVALQGATGAHLVGSGDQTITGGSENTVLRGKDGDDALNGGGGADRAVYAGASSGYSWTVATNAAGFATGFTSVTDTDVVALDEGADLLSSVEALTFVGDLKSLSVLDPVQLFDGSNNLIGTFTTIQSAIDAASDGHTIRVAAGIYNESLTINVEVAIEGAGAGLTILEGALLTSLGVPSGTPLNDYFEQNNPAYSASLGVSISADNVSLSGFTITSFSEAIAINTSDGVSITDNEFIDNVTGIRKGTAQNVTNIEISNNSFSQGIHGMTIYAAADGSGAFDGVVMNDNSFSALSEKGMYFEQLSNATLDDNLFDDVGNFGRISPPFGGTQGEFGQAIDINLKYENYQNVVFNDTIITNSGHSDQDGAASPGLFGAAIGVKIRDDAPSYNSQPATFTGSIVFNGGSIDGTSTGFRVGEPGKNNLGPNVEINGVEISNATVTDVENASHPTNGGVTDVVMPAGQNSLDGSASQAPLHVAGTAGGDDIVTGSGDDIISGGAGDDTIDGGDGIDTVVQSGSIDDYTPTFGSLSITDVNPGDGDDGTDDLSNIEIVEFADGTIRVVGGDSDYATIQAAVDDSNPGDIIIVRAGVYAEQVVVNGIDNLTIMAAAGEQVTIEAPATLVQTTTSSSGRSVFSIVTVENADNVVIEDIDIDGLGVTTGLSGVNPNNTGVYYRNASGGLENVSVTGVHDPYPGGTAAGGEPIVSGVQRGVAVIADNDAGPVKAFFMHGGTIDDFQKNATSFIYADLDISGVTITGGGAQTIIAQNGIQASNSTGSIDGNTITGIGYAGPSVAYSGAILGFGNTDLDITDNTIVGSNNDDLNGKVVGIFLLDFGTPNSGGSVTGNNVSYVDTGIGVYGDIQPNEIAVSNNTISNIDLGDPFAAGVDHEPNAGLATVFNVEGSGVGDILFGSDAGDTLTGLAGDDLIAGGAGDDSIDGGGDGDDISAGDGRDLIFANNGNDTVLGEAGRDTIDGGKGYDRIFGGGERDRLFGGDKNDVLDGGAGDDIIDGGDDNDVVFGGDNADAMTGGVGHDTIDGGSGDDTAVGGSGRDALLGDLGADALTGDSGRDTLNGGDGNDTLTGGAQRDRFFGGDGNDLITFDGGKNTAYFVIGDDVDTIADFNAGPGSGDLIRLIGFGAAFDTFVEVLAAATDNGTDTTIEFGGGDTLILKGVLVSDLDVSDFTFG